MRTICHADLVLNGNSRRVNKDTGKVGLISDYSASYSEKQHIIWVVSLH